MSQSFTVKVFFRGDWCPWCSAYLNDFNGVKDRIADLGGKVVGITAQAGNQSKQNLGLDYDIVVDEANTEAKKYDIFITPKDQSPLKDVEGVYPSGMVQPGVVVESDEGTILFRWAIDPNEMNFGGATDRPLVSDILSSLENILNGDAIDGDSFAKTDMDYLAQNHPAQHEQVQAYLASLNN
jgi:peroxiredoxin